MTPTESWIQGPSRGTHGTHLSSRGLAGGKHSQGKIHSTQKVAITPTPINGWWINNCGGTSLVAQWLRIRLPGFPGGAVVKNPPAGLPWWRSG